MESSKTYIQDQRVFPSQNQRNLDPEEDLLEDEHTTAYYGGEAYNTNGLYVVNPPTAAHGIPSDNYGYLPTPPPPPQNVSNTSRYVYPENAGHLV